MRDERGQVRGVLQGIDARELGLERRKALGLQAGLVQEARIQVGDLLQVGVAGRKISRQLVDQRAQLFLDGVAQFIEGAVGALVGRDLLGGQPLAVDVLVEVILGLDAAIHVLIVDSRNQRGARGVRRLGRTGNTGGGRAQQQRSQDHVLHRFPHGGHPKGTQKVRR